MFPIQGREGGSRGLEPRRKEACRIVRGSRFKFGTDRAPIRPVTHRLEVTGQPVGRKPHVAKFSIKVSTGNSENGRFPIPFPYPGEINLSHERAPKRHTQDQCSRPSSLFPSVLDAVYKPAVSPMMIPPVPNLLILLSIFPICFQAKQNFCRRRKLYVIGKSGNRDRIEGKIV